MDYKKYEKDNCNIHIINTDKFKTVNVRINFKKKIKKEEITLRNFLVSQLLYSSKKYRSSRDIEIEAEELYGISVDMNNYRSGRYIISSLKSSFLNEKYTEKGMNKKSLEFLLELLFNPDVCDNKFNEFVFEIVKRKVKDDISSIKENPGRYSNIKLFDYKDKDAVYSYHIDGYLDDLEKITPSNLYTYYKNMVENDMMDIFIVGNVDEEVVDVINKAIPNRKCENKLESHYLKSSIDNGNIRQYKEKMNINQSKLAIALNVDELDFFDKQYTLSVYNYILGGSNESKLFQEAREKNSLCYYISSSVSRLDSMMVITSGIDSKNYDRTIEIINKALDDIKNGDFDLKEIDKAKITYINSCNEITDSPSSILNNYISHEYLHTDLIEDRIKNIQKVTKEMVIEVAKKIKLDTVFLLEGDLNNE